MTATVITREPAPDLRAIKGRQQATWASGDYHMIGTQIVIVSELLIEALDVHSTERVLDVATGSGNAALAAARRGCEVIGVDYVPALLDRARRRAEAEGLAIEFVEGDAEALPFEDGVFDVTSSVFGSMFAPDQEKTAGELARVTRSGGRIGVVAHTPDGFIGNLFKVIAKHVPPPAGMSGKPLVVVLLDEVQRYAGAAGRFVADLLRAGGLGTDRDPIPVAFTYRKDHNYAEPFEQVVIRRGMDGGEPAGGDNAAALVASVRRQHGSAGTG